MQHSTTEGVRRWRWAAVAVWAACSFAWLRADKLLRDGDEEGHVGAAELFRADLVAFDLVGFIQRLWVGPMGEYPQAFAAVVGAWWWTTGIGDPADPVVRAVCLMSLPIAALATGRIAGRMISGPQSGLAECWATVLVLCVPLANGLTRHYMPEGALMAVTALAILAALRWSELPSLGRSVQLGAIVGLGLLTKQTVVLALAVPLVWVMRDRLRSHFPMVIAAIAIGGAIVGPWWWVNGQQQLAYVGSSASGQGGGDVWSHAMFYPQSLWWVGLGPVLAVAAVIAGWQGRGSRGWMLAMAWLVGGLIVLLLIPKKYPRLMAPLLPAVAVMAVSAWRSQPRVLAGVSAAAVVWLGWVSVAQVSIHARSPGVDPGCPQEWVRPPSATDLGLTEAVQRFEGLGPGDVLVRDDPAIPCSIQTTHDWSNHLSPLLRRRGKERAVHTDPTQPHRYVLEWSDQDGEHEVNALQKSFTIRDKLAP